MSPRRTTLLLCLLSLAGCRFPGASEPFIRWTMINVNGLDLQGDAHLLEFSSGKRVLIDVGHENTVIGDYLLSKNIRHIDTVFITHAHKDHYGGLPFLIRAGVQWDEIYFNAPDKAVCDAEIPWGCDYPHVLATRQALEINHTPPRTLSQGVVWQGGEGAQISVLYAFDGVHTPIGRTDINDMSLVLLLELGKTRALFTGDLNQSMGRYLAEHGQNLAAAVLKVPHHGTDTLAPDVFFEKVNPVLALVPSPRSLWSSDRSRRARTFFRSRKITTLVNGLNGHVQVLLTPQGFTPYPEYP